LETPSRHTRINLVLNAALVALAFGLLGLVIWRNSADIRLVFSRRLDLSLLGWAIGIYLVGVAATFFRWFLLVRVIEPKITLRYTMLLGAIGMVFNLVIPGAVGGDLIKAAYLVRMHIRKTQAIASMVIDRILGLLALFVLASIAGGFAWRMAQSDVRKLIVAAWVAVVLGVLVLVAIFAQVFTRLFPRYPPGHSRIGLIIAELREMSSTYRGRLDVVVGCLALSAAIHSLNVLGFYLVGRMLFPSMETPLSKHFLMVPLILFTMAVPLPFGALGLSEGVSGQLFKLVNHPNGALAMLGFRVLMYSSGLCCACVYLSKLKEVRGLTSSARHIEEELLGGELTE
jgi:uncharacterized membrane protein YbhN (UPF0104 family)